MRFRIGMCVRKNGGFMHFSNRLVEVELVAKDAKEARRLAQLQLEAMGYYVQSVLSEENITGHLRGNTANLIIQDELHD